MTQVTETSFVHNGACEDTEHPEGFAPPKKVRVRLTEEELERIIRWYFVAQDHNELRQGDLTLAAKLGQLVVKLAKMTDTVMHE